MFIDTHCHLLSEYYEDIDAIILENRQNKVEKIIISGCEIEDLEESIRLASQYDDVYLSLGFHPSESDKISDIHLKRLEDLLSHPKVVALGEIGLDYHYGKDNMERQKELFEYQLSLAVRLSLPVVIHSRDATKDTIDILSKYPVKGVIHCFSGSLETALQYIKMGYLIGIGGVVTFKNSNLPHVVEKLDLSSIVLETDSPYLAPTPYRGEKNSSKYIPVIAQKIAEIQNVSVEDVMNQTSLNAMALFDFS